MTSQEVDSNLYWRLELKNLPILRRLGRGLSGYLYETIWGGKKYARKDFPLGSVERNSLFESEVKTLFKLDHPNIVKCFGYTVGKSSCSLLQEYVADNLQNTIQRRIDQELRKKGSIGTSGSRVLDIDEIKRLLSSRVKEKGKGKKKVDSRIPGCRSTISFEVPEAVEIISQIATGMKYLHDNGVVHGDLKPRNVLLFSESGGWKVKLADVGLTETKKRIKLVSKRTRHIEILTWKAPECLEELLGPLTQDSDDLFTESDTDSDEDIGSPDDFLKSKLAMADVYSFGLTCSYILGGKLLCPDMSLTELRQQRMQGFKPKLPSACLEYLKFMIGSCLESEPLSRPTFSTICTMKDVLPHLSLPQLADLMEGSGKEYFTKMTTLSLDDYPSLLNLPSEVGNLATLTTLSMKNCSSLEDLPSEIDMMKQIPNLQQGAQNQNDSAGEQVVQNVGQQAGPTLTSSSAAETMRDIGIAHDPFDQLPNLQHGVTRQLHFMNHAEMQSAIAAIPGRSEQIVHRHLQTLVEELDWSYITLWSLNHQTRNLGWTGGHFRVNSTAVTGGHGGTEVWNEQLFNSTYKSCHFTRNLGSVGTALADGRNIWMNGPSVLKHAGTKEQADFLQHARIATALCIPWTDGVLELGTCDSVPENPELMENIRQFLLKNIVPDLGQPSSHNTLIGVSQAPPNFPQASLAPRSMMQQHAPFSSLNSLTSRMSETLSSPNFEPNSLNQQIRRTASLSSLNTDMFLQLAEDGTDGKDQAGNELDTDLLLNPDLRNWRLPTTTRASDSLPISATVAASQAFQYNPPAQQSARVQNPFRSNMPENLSTTSFSVGSLENCSAKYSVDSPEQNNTTSLGASSQRRTSHSNTSSFPPRGILSHSPKMNQLEDVTTTKTGAPASMQESALEGDDIQTAISLMLADGEDQEQRRNIYSPLETGKTGQMNLLESSTNGKHNNSSFNPHVVGNHESLAQTTATSMVAQMQGPFKSWRQTRILAPILQKNDRTNQELLRRCFDMLKRIPNLQGVQNQKDSEAEVQNVVKQKPSVSPTSSAVTVLPDIGIAHDPFDQPGPRREQRRSRGGSRIASMDPVHAGHDEEVMNHLMAERGRRVKQKENFTALRRLVPIISKAADKASILGDAIVYLKDLQEQIKELEASRDEAQRRFETLQLSYKDLEQRNKELEAMAGSSASMQQRGATRGLHSMQSF